MKPTRRVAVLQSSYIPWKGYFDIINDVDTFIFYDDVQFTYQDWRSRNRIIANGSTHWLTVPTGSNIDRLIHEVSLPDPRWQKKHWRTISQSYAKAPHFRDYRDLFEEIYLGHQWRNLSELNQHLVTTIARDLLGVKVDFRDSREYGAEGQKLDRLLDLLAKAGTTRYVSGPAASSYIDPLRFQAAGIELVYKDYGGYPEYPQSHAPFRHDVSVLDLLFQTGVDAPAYIWGWRGLTAAG